MRHDSPPAPDATPALPGPPLTEPTARMDAPGASPPAFDSTALLQGGKSVTIRHNGECYRLQATRQGKLILTK